MDGFTLSSNVACVEFKTMATDVLGGALTQFGLHSLRAGAANDAELQGCSLSEIMFQGSWKSGTVLQYAKWRMWRMHWVCVYKEIGTLGFCKWGSGL